MADQDNSHYDLLDDVDDERSIISSARLHVNGPIDPPDPSPCPRSAAAGSVAMVV
ncbi:uncharacterized protein MAM_08072 [Metarhizium album ARSEF 1941]|uniref:Uncharacterized protein n=1 Tax=Metarhizium album (strain ARSEF 1941) TaxID=1081103 RepID=A0A0B2WJF8_METAS|nr:uncharacterized protein MAM_08072 [Metarhizium album ARSEF 1941]KHN94063.1 hypothetical protein MAM_08072 [Metarhizium album ARSEF 1941]